MTKRRPSNRTPRLEGTLYRLYEVMSAIALTDNESRRIAGADTRGYIERVWADHHNSPVGVTRSIKYACGGRVVPPDALTFDTEREAIAALRTYRIMAGLDPDNGNPVEE